MTGKYAANVGLHTALIPGNPAGLDPKYTILPESLSKLGYKNCNYVFDYLSCYSPYEFMHFQFSNSCDLLISSIFDKCSQKFTSMNLLQMPCVIT